MENNRIISAMALYEKEIRAVKYLKCHNCLEHYHFSCTPKALTEASKERSIANGDYECPSCLVYPAQRKVQKDESNQLDILKKHVTLAIEDCSPSHEEASPLEVSPQETESNQMETEQPSSQFYCDICKLTFLGSDVLNKHIEASHGDKRGNKRSRHETSLMFEPSTCNHCEDFKASNTKLVEQLNLSQFAYNETKENLNKINADHAEKEQELQDKVKEERKRAEVLQAEFTACKEQLATAKKNITILEDEVRKANMELDKLKEDQLNPSVDAARKSEELDILKEMIVEKDKNIKRIEDIHKKELDKVKLDKQASEEALKCAITENTKLKDKETTLLDIFKSMNQFMSEKIGILGNIPNLPQTDKKMFCDQCEFQTKSIEQLTSHKRDVHIRAALLCKTCNFEASNKEQLSIHEKTHGKLARFKCDQCPFIADTKHSLETHKHDEHIYTCEQCKFEDKREENVLNHIIAQHSTITCELCDYSTSSEENLALHETNIHKRTKHNCTECNSNFSSTKKLSDHKKQKHKENIFPCDHCGYRAGSIQSLDSHIKTHNKKQDKNVDMRDLSDRSPCNFTDPSHTDDCCNSNITHIP